MTTEEAKEAIEGLQTDEDRTLGDYPIDTVLIRHEPRTVHEVLRRMTRGDYVMDPDFQRDFVWPADKQSKLIESVLMRIPLPVFYLAENSDGKTVVVDGLQRLTTFSRFVNNEFALKLPGQSALNKKKFSELSPKLQNRIEDTMLVLYLIDSKVPSQALLDIFERVNGGVPLTRQQMRNCLYSGPATRWLKSAASKELFREATGDSLSSLTMRDREMVNRFAAFRVLPLDSYKGEMDAFLADALLKVNSIGEGQLAELDQDFERVLRFNIRAFGEHAFRKFRLDRSNRSVFNVSLWDIMTAALAGFDTDVSDDKVEKLVIGMVELLETSEFNAAVTYSTNQTDRVRTRFQMANRLFSEVLSAY